MSLFYFGVLLMAQFLMIYGIIALAQDIRTYFRRRKHSSKG